MEANSSVFHSLNKKFFYHTHPWNTKFKCSIFVFVKWPQMNYNWRCYIATPYIFKFCISIFLWIWIYFVFYRYGKLYAAEIIHSTELVIPWLMNFSIKILLSSIKLHLVPVQGVRSFNIYSPNTINYDSLLITTPWHVMSIFKITVLWSRLFIISTLKFDLNWPFSCCYSTPNATTKLFGRLLSVGYFTMLSIARSCIFIKR
jgi:hypothetical protein